MPIKFSCLKCGASLRVPEKHIGKKARCPKCDEKCVVPETSERGDSASSLGSEFEDLSNLVNQPVAAAPLAVATAGIPAAKPVAPPAMMPPAVAPPYVGTQSPYASPVSARPAASSGAIASVMQPLYEARTFMKIWGWMNFIIGILYCLTIVGAIVGWLFVWIGWLVKGAGEAVTIGMETGDHQYFHLANDRLATFFKIMGVLAIIGLAMMALYFLFVILMFILMIAGAATA